MSSKTSPVVSSSHEISGVDHHRSEQLELKLLAMATYGLFLLATIYGRLLRGRYQSPAYREARSIWREAWENACGTIAFAFNHG